MRLYVTQVPLLEQLLLLALDIILMTQILFDLATSVCLTLVRDFG